MRRAGRFCVSFAFRPDGRTEPQYSTAVLTDPRYFFLEQALLSLALPTAARLGGGRHLGFATPRGASCVGTRTHAVRISFGDDLRDVSLFCKEHIYSRPHEFWETHINS